MKTKILLSLSLLVFGISSINSQSLYEQMVEVNAQWAYQGDIPEWFYQNDEQYEGNGLLQRHLFSVYNILSNRSTDHLTRAQKQARQSHLKTLKSYAQRGLFPKNHFFQGRRPVFIDPDGTHCAVGYLIKESGDGWLSQKISRNMNYAYVLDMDDNDLVAWQQESGFTVEELAWIQPGYPLAVHWNDMKGGANNSVFTIISDGAGSVFAGGDFDTIGGNQASSVAQYMSGFAGWDWIGLSLDQLRGRVYDVIEYQGDIYAAGAFFGIDSGSGESAVAKWNGTKWEPVGQFYIGALVNIAYTLEVYRDTLYAGGFFRSRFTAQDRFNHLAKWDGSEWRAIDTNLMMGGVSDLAVHDDKLIVAGTFDQYGSVQVNNIMAIDSTGQFQMLGNGLPIPIHALEVANDTLYAGGELLSWDQQDTIGVARLDGNAWQTILPVSQFGNVNKQRVYDIEWTPYGLFIGGDLDLFSMFSIGKNFFRLHNGSIYTHGIVDSTVRALHYENNKLYLGGEFESGLRFGGTQALGHIALLDLNQFFSIKEDKGLQATVYPNPTEGMVQVSLPEGVQVDNVQVFDLSGKLKEVGSTIEGHSTQLDMSRLAKGVYILKLESDIGVLEEKVILN